MNYLKNLIFHKLSFSNNQYIDISSNKDISISKSNTNTSNIENFKNTNKKEEKVTKKDDKEVKDKISIQLLDRENQVNILTYNLFLRPLVSSNGNDYKEQRLEDFLDELERFDIICFQEVFGLFNSRKTKLIYEAAKRGYYYYAEPPSPNFLSVECMDGGVLIISRFCIEKIDFLPYTFRSQIDAIVVKGLVYVKLKIKDTYFHLFNTHLQATYNYFTKEERVYYATRKSQIEELALNISELLKRHYFNNTEKIMFCGDLNVDALHDSDFTWLYGEHKTEYNYLMNELNKYDYTATNIYPKYKGEHPITFGADDKILYPPDMIDYRNSLDYMIEIKYIGDIDKNVERINSTRSISKKNNVFKDNSKSELNIDYNSIKIEHFLLEEGTQKLKKRPYKQLSDHFGLSIRLRYGEDNLEKLSEDEENLKEIKK